MEQPTPRERFLASLERCRADEAFITAFYERLLDSSDEIRARFAETDFEKQNALLLRSLQLAAGAATGDPESLRELRERAESHDRHHLDIPPPLYDHWLSSVVATAAEFDPQWNEPLAQAWQTVLGHVTRHMAKHY